MKIVFMGTPEFALPTLKALAEKHEVVCVYTKEPKEAGRGKDIQKTPIHLWAEANGIEVRTPKSLRSEEEQEKFMPDGLHPNDAGHKLYAELLYSEIKKHL